MLRRLAAVTDQEIMSAPAITVLVLNVETTEPLFLLQPSAEDDHECLTLVVESRDEIVAAEERVHLVLWRTLRGSQPAR